MFLTPVSGSFVIHWLELVNGAASKPGVEIGMGNSSSPMPGRSRSSRMWTSSCTGPAPTSAGSIGWARARVQRSVISAGSHCKPAP